MKCSFIDYISKKGTETQVLYIISLLSRLWLEIYEAGTLAVHRTPKWGGCNLIQDFECGFMCLAQRQKGKTFDQLRHSVTKPTLLILQLKQNLRYCKSAASEANRARMQIADGVKQNRLEKCKCIFKNFRISVFLA